MVKAYAIHATFATFATFAIFATFVETWHATSLQRIAPLTINH
jgi:hypothetical protein